MRKIGSFELAEVSKDHCRPQKQRRQFVQWDEFASAEMTDLTGKLADVPKSQRGIIQQ
jgi:hypothetical protein